MQFLKKSVDALHNKLQREQAEHAKNRVFVMKTNQDLIDDITELKARVEIKRGEFNKAGGLKKLKEIMDKTAERERMQDQFEQQERQGGAMDYSMENAAANADYDPILQQKIQKKREYIEKLRQQAMEIRQENEMLQQQYQYGNMM